MRGFSILNVEIATICGMVHDIYPLYTGVFEDHARKGAFYVKALLESLDIFSDEEIKLITQAVYRHSDKKIIDEPYDELLKDADVMYHCLYDSDDPIREKEIERYKNLLNELGCTVTLDT
ncbi:MAG: HD domain-containing protein [Ruminiclostridium sp.]